MMCKGHTVNALVSKNYGSTGYQTVLIEDANPLVTDTDSIEGDVLLINIDEDNYISFDRHGAKAFVEACQEIVSRYDREVQE